MIFLELQQLLTICRLLQVQRRQRNPLAALGIGEEFHRSVPCLISQSSLVIGSEEVIT